MASTCNPDLSTTWACNFQHCKILFTTPAEVWPAQPNRIIVHSWEDHTDVQWLNMKAPASSEYLTCSSLAIFDGPPRSAFYILVDLYMSNPRVYPERFLDNAPIMLGRTHQAYSPHWLFHQGFTFSCSRDLGPGGGSKQTRTWFWRITVINYSIGNLLNSSPSTEH